jgi:2'-5' RNA ligase
LRSFVALELKDEGVKDRIAQLQRQLLKSGATLKAVERQNLHITLKFLGEVPETAVGEIEAALRGIRLEPFSLHFKGVGSFPSISRINVVWVGVVEGAEKVEALHEAVEGALAPFGHPERFHSHLTIMRVKGGRKVGELVKSVMALSQEEIGTAFFESFQLKKSVLTPSGPVYSDLATFPLR